MECSKIKIAGYDILGTEGKDGIRFAWEYEHSKPFIESAAFPQRRKNTSDDICGYTTSVSAGCVLHAFKSQCLFCRTGNLLPFCGFLSYRDIAKQNIFMVLADINCKDHPELHNRPREFAYMGQGEPGYSYSQVRLAIELTNRVMKKLGQTVHRHIFATSGVPEAITAFKEDLQDHYTERVTLHFSLHATKDRALLMPIDSRYSYKDVLQAMEDIFTISGEKPCIGIMLFKNFKPNYQEFSYSNDFEAIKRILSELDPKTCRLSFCEYNASDDICQSDLYLEDDAKNILHYAIEKGFDAKLFSSFGREQHTACGMLGGKTAMMSVSDKWLLLDKEADRLIDLCI